MRFKRSTYLRWWQVRTIDFALFLFPIIGHGPLVFSLFIIALTREDPDKVPMSLAMDATFAGIHAPQTLKHIIILGWFLLILAAFSAFLERCYRWPKAFFIFGSIAALMVIMTVSAMTAYEPYLAVRR